MLDGFTLAGYSAMSAASVNQDALAQAILAAGRNPTPETIEAEKAAEIRVQMSIEIVRKVNELARQQGEELVALMDQSIGLGQNLNLTA